MSRPITTGIREALNREFTIEELIEQCDAIDAIDSGLGDLLHDAIEKREELEAEVAAYKKSLAGCESKSMRLMDVLSLYQSTLTFEDLAHEDLLGDREEFLAELHHIMSRVRSVVGEPWLS